MADVSQALRSALAANARGQEPAPSAPTQDPDHDLHRAYQELEDVVEISRADLDALRARAAFRPAAHKASALSRVGAHPLRRAVSFRPPAPAPAPPPPSRADVPLVLVPTTLVFSHPSGPTLNFLCSDQQGCTVLRAVMQASGYAEVDVVPVCFMADSDDDAADDE